VFLRRDFPSGPPDMDTITGRIGFLSGPLTTHAASALAAAIILAVIAWMTGSVIIPRSPATERLAAGLLVVIGLGAVAMLQAWAGGSILSRPWLMGGVVIATLATGLAMVRPRLSIPRPHVSMAIWFATTLIVTLPGWWSPTSVTYSTDMLWHQGWIRQLMSGDTAPTGGLYDGVPNAYPWLYHSIAAATVETLPGGVTDALLVVELLGVATLGVGIWLLSRELGLGERAASWALALSIAGGGIGWLWARGPAAVTLQVASASHRFHGDLLVGNAPTTGLGDVYPLLPREFGADLVPLSLWLILRARANPRVAYAAGATTGLVALASPTAAIGAMATQLILSATRGRPPVMTWSRLLVSFSAVASIWLVPLAVHAHQLGGLVTTSLTAPLSPSPAETLVAFGVLTPLALLGLRAAPNRFDLALLAIVPTVIALAAVAANGASLPGGPAITRDLRYLPLIAAGCCPAAGLGVDTLLSAARRGWLPVGAALAAAALASPTLAAIHLAAASHQWVDRNALTCDPRLPATSNDVVAGVGLTPFLLDRLSMQLFAQTGASPAWTRHARVRYARPHTPSQATRRQWAHNVATGHGPTGPITLALATPRAYLQTSGTCSFDSSVVGRLPTNDQQHIIRLDWLHVGH
jgi:hypothetical protein